MPKQKVTFNLASNPSNLPIVQVRFTELNGKFREIETVLDTGSGRCVLTLGIARVLDIEVSGSPNGTVKGILGVSKNFWLREVTICLDNGKKAFEWKAPIAFTGAQPIFPVLGWIGCFEFFSTTFDGNPRKVIFKSNSSFPGRFQST